MVKIPKVTLKREECISCGACAAVAPELFEMDEDGKSTLKGSAESSGIFSKNVNDSLAEKAKEAADSCPVKIIDTQ